MDSKQRKIRSLRGFFLYALEIMKTGKEYEILSTNLQPFFWRKVKTIIRQNQKAALLKFLFGKAELNQDQILGLIPHLQDQMKALNNQVDSLQQKIIQLESKLENLEAKYLTENDSDISRRKDIESKLHSDEPSIDSKPLSNNQQYSISSHQEKGLDEPDFRSLPEHEQKEIIKTGFQLQAEGKISFKKYYESTDPYSLFQWKRYSFKYETVRKYKLYKDLKKDFKEQLKDN